MFMKTFEEKWTAWIDGELSDAERAEFEASLPDRAAAEAEKTASAEAGRAFEGADCAPRDGQRRILQPSVARTNRGEIARAEPASGACAGARAWWTIGRLALDWRFLAGCLCGLRVFRHARETVPPDQSQYLTQILNARVDPGVNPNATVSIFQTKQDRVTVLWVDGLKSLPSDYAAK